MEYLAFENQDHVNIAPDFDRLALLVACRALLMACRALLVACRALFDGMLGLVELNKGLSRKNKLHSWLVFDSLLESS
jgi:hypothetical protein